MRRLFPFAFALAAVFAPQPAGAAKPKPPKLVIGVAQVPSPAPVGESAEVILEISAPEGIVLNRYPGLTLRLERTERLRPERREIFVGSKKPLEDPAHFYFGQPVPLRLTLTPTGESASATGTLSFFYCVKKSGYCAPGRQPVEIPLEVASR